MMRWLGNLTYDEKSGRNCVCSALRTKDSGLVGVGGTSHNLSLSKRQLQRRWMSIFTRIHSDRTRSNWHKLPWGKFCIICNKCFTVRTINHWHMLLGEAMEPLSPETLKTQPDKVLEQGPGKPNLRPCIQQKVGPDKLWKSIPAQIFLRFYDSTMHYIHKYLFSGGVGLKILKEVLLFFVFVFPLIKAKVFCQIPWRILIDIFNRFILA